MSKELLRELMREIKKCKKPCRTNPWFFPEENEVSGFLGNGEVMFVRGNPPCKRLDCSFELFYELLKKYGFYDSHLTTLVKCKRIDSNERGISMERLKNCIKYFKRELEIVKPKTIVALNGKVYEILKGILATLTVRNVQLLKIWSYSYAYRCREREEYEKLFIKIKKCINS